MGCSDFGLFLHYYVNCLARTHLFICINVTLNFTKYHAQYDLPISNVSKNE